MGQASIPARVNPQTWALLAGALLQPVAGIGFSLVVAPLLTLDRTRRRTASSRQRYCRHLGCRAVSAATVIGLTASTCTALLHHTPPARMLILIDAACDQWLAHQPGL